MRVVLYARVSTEEQVEGYSMGLIGVYCAPYILMAYLPRMFS